MYIYTHTCVCVCVFVLICIYSRAHPGAVTHSFHHLFPVNLEWLAYTQFFTTCFQRSCSQHLRPHCKHLALHRLHLRLRGSGMLQAPGGEGGKKNAFNHTKNPGRLYVCTFVE